MADTLPTVRARLAEKANQYLVFEVGRALSVKKSTWLGATDALLDASSAARSYSGLQSCENNYSLLHCYGFLQALYVQQDAVKMLSDLVGDKWSPWSRHRLAGIRCVRNRLTGHPVKSNGNKKRASGIIVHHSIGPDRFQGVIYWEDGGSKLVTIDVGLYLRDNEAELSSQLLRVESRLACIERAERLKWQEQMPFLRGEPDLRYLVERANCEVIDQLRVVQALGHWSEISAWVNSWRCYGELEGSPGGRLVATIERINFAIERIMGILKADGPQSRDQVKFDVMWAGFYVLFERLQGQISELRGFLGAKV